MTKQGRVIAILNDMAHIAAIRESACGENCAHCKGNCTKSDIKFFAKNTIGAKVGDEVLIYADTKKVFASLFCLYVLPVILVIISVFLGSLYFKNDLVTVLFCAISLFLWIAVIKIINKTKIEHSVIKVVKSND